MPETKEKDPSLAIVTCLGSIVFLPLLLTVSCLLNGWALTILWTWFIVPYFHVAPLSVALAIGISLTVNFVTASRTYIKHEYYDTTSALVWTIAGPLLVLGIGWIVHQFVH